MNLTIVGVVLLLAASAGAVWLQPEPVEAASGPVHIEAPAEMAVAFASILPAPAIAALAPAGSVGIGLVDPTSGVWHLRTRAGDPASFYFGNPGDYPMVGDWDCNGTDTPGLYRQSDGYVYLRNSNTQGVADIRFFFGNPGDVPLAGDFNGDGCDTVSIYRPTESRIYIINKLGQNNGGLGAADYAYYFGNPGDKPFAGDFNGNGITTSTSATQTRRASRSSSSTSATQVTGWSPATGLVTATTPRPSIARRSARSTSGTPIRRATPTSSSRGATPDMSLWRATSAPSTRASR
jgi:hypothetical protein